MSINVENSCFSYQPTERIAELRLRWFVENKNMKNYQQNFDINGFGHKCPRPSFVDKLLFDIKIFEFNILTHNNYHT
jgi:hypothetical protein